MQRYADAAVASREQQAGGRRYDDRAARTETAAARTAQPVGRSARHPGHRDRRSRRSGPASPRRAGDGALGVPSRPTATTAIWYAASVLEAVDARRRRPDRDQFRADELRIERREGAGAAVRRGQPHVSYEAGLRGARRPGSTAPGGRAASRGRRRPSRTPASPSSALTVFTSVGALGPGPPSVSARRVACGERAALEHDRPQPRRGRRAAAASERVVEDRRRRAR